MRYEVIARRDILMRNSVRDVAVRNMGRELTAIRNSDRGDVWMGNVMIKTWR